MKKKQKVLIGLLIVTVLSIGITSFFMHSNEDEELVSALMEQFDLTSEINTESEDETGIILEGSTFLDDFQTIYGQLVTVNVTEMKDDHAVLNITAPDLYSVLKITGDEQLILQNLQSKDVSRVTNEVAVNYEKTEEGYYIEESKELINAIYGNAINYFEELGSI